MELKPQLTTALAELGRLVCYACERWEVGGGRMGGWESAFPESGQRSHDL